MAERVLADPVLAGPVLALVGPTASGKSVLALQAAERIGAEIVAVDAFSVYRGMDVGTATPSAAQRARVSHHLLDVLDPWEDCHVAWFQQAARTAVREVADRGRVPLLVGGSGLYFRAVVDPLEFPPTDPDVRAEIAAHAARDRAAVHAELAAADPASGAAIDAANQRRVVRALEVLALTGRPFSDWRQAWDRYESVYPGLVVVGVRLPRAELAVRISARVETMFASGLVEECQALRSMPLSSTARQAIGYAEVLEALDGRATLAEAAERTAARTRRYAARQSRWFATDPRVRWHPPLEVVEVLSG